MRGKEYTRPPVLNENRKKKFKLLTYVSGSWGHWDTQCESDVSYSTMRTRMLGMSRTNQDLKRPVERNSFKPRVSNLQI